MLLSSQMQLKGSIQTQITWVPEAMTYDDVMASSCQQTWKQVPSDL